MHHNSDAPYLLEFVDRSGQVRERIYPTAERILIGRGYDCDVILDDAYLCAHHVEIYLDEQGVLQVKDLGSINGLATRRHGTKHESLSLEQGQDCYIGWTGLRFRSRQSEVAPARLDYSRHFLFSIFQRPAWLALLTSLPVAHLIFLTWLEQSREIEWHDMMIVPASVYLALCAWALVWAVVGRVIVHRAMFLTHLAIGTLMMSASLIIESLIGYSAFILDTDVLQEAAVQINTFVATVIVLYLHLHFSTRMNARRQFGAALSASLLISITGAYLEYVGVNGFSSSPQYTGSLKPPAFIIQAPQDVETFFSDFDQLRSSVDEMKQED